MSRNQTLQLGSLDQAKRMLSNYLIRASGKFPESTFYPALTKNTLIKDLIDRVDLLKLVVQEGSLCGPASFIYALLNTHPDLYVQLVLDLYLKGKTTLGNLQLEPSSKAAGNVPPGMDAVDWIALTGMKSNYYEKEQQVAGITMPGTLVNWFEQTGFKSVVDETNLFSTKGLDALMQAQLAYTGGYSVCLLVHAEAFQNDSRDGSWLPNHWVVLSSLIQVAKWDEAKKALGPYVFINYQVIAELNKDLAEAHAKTKEMADRDGQIEKSIECQHRIRFTVYSWGYDTIPVQGIAQTPGEATVCYFLRHFFGYVKARW